MGFLSVLGMAQKLVAERLPAGGTAIDATCGNGVDAFFLAGLAGPRGTLYAFDVQEQAIVRTRERLRPLAEAGRLPDTRLLLASHADMAAHVDAAARGRVSAVMFNLGYLPGADPGVITAPASSLEAMEAGLRLLRSGGVLTAVLYPGHPGGDEEAAAVEAWAAAVAPSAGQTIVYRMAQKPRAPYLVAVETK